MRGGRPNALSAARAPVGLVFCATLGGAALAFDHPLPLLGLIVAVIAIGLLAGQGRRLARAALLALPLALVVGVVNAFVNREGDTVVLRLGSLPVVGRIDVTAEALALSGVLVLRVVAVVLAAALFAACVDQDAVLRILRRRAGRFGLSVALAARLAPLLVRDGRAMARARRTLAPGIAASRTAVFESLATGALDRAVDAAAALELRGLGDTPCLAAAPKRAWSRHDRALAASAVSIAFVSAAALISDWTFFTAHGALRAAGGPLPWVVAALLSVLAVWPMFDRRGVAR